MTGTDTSNATWYEATAKRGRQWPAMGGILVARSKRKVA